MLRTTVLLFLLGSLPVSLRAQSDPEELLRRAVTRINDTLDRLPKYMCTQTIERDQLRVPPNDRRRNPCDARPSSSQLQLTHSDRLRLDVASTSTGEMYSWAGEGRFHDEELYDMVRNGYIASGGFSGFLGSVFGNQGTEFFYHGESRVEGRLLQEYAFGVSREKSQYWFGLPRHQEIVAFDGTFLVDPETADLVRLVVNVKDPPPETGACAATNTLEYGHTHLRDADFLLPKEIRLEVMHPSGLEARNRTLFSGCHEFLGESTLQFEAPDPARVSQPAASAPTVLDLPPGVPFRIALADDIDTGVAAAGDSVAAKLTSSIEDASHKVLLAAGTPVTVRILQLERNYVHDGNQPGAAAVELSMLFRVETAIVAGTARRIVATADPVMRSFDKVRGALTQYRSLGTLETIMFDPGSAKFRFWNVPLHHVIKAGTESNWTTGRRGGRRSN